MRNGKFAKRGVATKSMVMILALVLVIGCAIGGTLAWLTAETAAVENTFTVGNINIELKEHKDGDKSAEEVTSNGYAIVPGDTLNKDPFVRVKATSEACYLFIYIDETNNTVTGLDGKVIQYTVNTTNWTAVEGHAGYYYKVLDAQTTTDTLYYILANDQVTVNSNLTKAMIDSTVATNAPKLTFYAAAVQKDNVTDVTVAWTKLPTTFTAHGNA